MERIRQLLEHSAFGVCHYLAERMGIASARVRLYFIYASCLTLGSPVLFYLVAAFWLNIKRYIRKGRRMILDF